MKMILLGPPGAGKGTQAEILSRVFDIPTISTGNILRAAVKAGTPTGLKAKSYMDAGKLVPDEVIIGIVQERLAQEDCKGGFILDGVPRTIAQAEALEERGIEFDHVISLEIDDDAIVKRMDGRRVCTQCGAPFHTESKPPKQEGVCDLCGGALMERDDDKPETVRDRLVVYHNETEPLKHFYEARGKLDMVPGDLGTIQDTTRAIKEALEAKKQ
ncbi:MAG TPA: adenylate kinase [Candidatus Intestinimonas stercoravium]|uniref:adenylate kinase n=1 Tax=uncultured Intestinimonas sp. TaxID=1689265 RepID=UPI001F87F3BA|nr:adenylate kinase [uncultured Intestinimonas sp.]HJA63280.1 adenylate kinase [Candidatus Intestinimonas stercoravium]